MKQGEKAAYTISVGGGNDLREAQKLQCEFRQGAIVITKQKDAFDGITGTAALVSLTPEETKRFNTGVCRITVSFVNDKGLEYRLHVMDNVNDTADTEFVSTLNQLVHSVYETEVLTDHNDTEITIGNTNEPIEVLLGSNIFEKIKALEEKVAALEQKGA